MTLTLLYFAVTRELAGVAEERIDVPASVRTVSDLRAHLEREKPVFRGRLAQVRFARNERFADDADLLATGDIVALIPPVAGG
jgi:molybdopterin converting factor subunit 1